jgi:hypothetical protein
VWFSPSVQQQRELAKKDGAGLSGQFVVQYDVDRDPQAGEVLVSTDLRGGDTSSQGWRLVGRDAMWLL